MSDYPINDNDDPGKCVASEDRPTHDRAVIWMADGEPTPYFDYGHLLETYLKDRGVEVVRGRMETDEHLDESPALHILTGGSTSVNDLSTWMPRGLAHTSHLIDLAEDGNGKIKVIGVCLGAQMIAASLWRSAVRRRTDIEVGLVTVRWEHGPSPVDLVVSAFHYEEIDPEFVIRGGGTIIAGSEESAVQAFVMGPHVVGTQFHPELTPDDMLSLIEHNRGMIREFGGDPTLAQAWVNKLEPRWSPDVLDLVLDSVSVRL